MKTSRFINHVFNIIKIVTGDKPAKGHPAPRHEAARFESISCTIALGSVVDRAAVLLCVPNVEFIHAFPF
jgi:hypothetical protein